MATTRHPLAIRRHTRTLTRGASRARGFSLVEVLASLVLVAVVLPVAMRCISLSVNASSLAAQRMNATTLGQQKLNELLVTGDYRGAQQQGDFGDDWPNFKWTAKTSDFDELVQTLELTVTWTSHAGEQNLTFTTLVYTEA